MAKRANTQSSDRKTAIWLGQRRARLVIGGLVGAVGVGGAFTLPSDATKAKDNVRKTDRDAVRQKAAIQLSTSWDLPNLDHDRVDYWVERFSFNADMRDKMEGFLSRSGRYVPMILEKLDERGMPHDLIYLAMIESGFQPEAYSTASASGLWQFIPETGERYGLEIDRAVDERNDPVRATDAALDYLEYLHDRFDSWYLAAAAYNSGEGRVGRIMRETYGREEAASEQDYYRIWSKLPSETRDYVPLMIAAGRIAKEPHKYGFSHVEPQAALEYQEVVVPPATQLEDVADAAGVTLSDIHALNPHFKLNRTPNDRDYPVRIPVGTLREFAQNWNLELGEEVQVALNE